MTGKENYINGLLHKKTEWVLVEGEDLMYTGFEGNEMEKGPVGGGKDGFGVLWIAPDSGANTAIPAPNQFLLNSETICDWKDIINFPDPSQYHWEEDAKTQLEGVDINVCAVDYGDGNGPFERLAAFMGFEQALMAMFTESEATAQLLEAIADYKIECLDYIAKYYKPDTYTLYDDTATQNSTFMSPKTYRELIKPQHQRIVKRAKELGMIPILHCCGHADALAEDFMEEGFAAWASVQPCNDIVSILEKYGDRFCICGGYDTNGTPGFTSDSVIMNKEIERCFSTYASLPGYVFAGFIMTVNEDDKKADMMTGSIALFETAAEYSHTFKR